jgi:hypothetical protein
MQGCHRLSNSRPEIDGLDDLLMAPEQQLHDVALEREQRRSSQGYATPADARAFLQMARPPRAAPTATNPIAAAYFRAVEEEEEEAHDAPASARTSARPVRGDEDSPASIETVIELLAEAGLMSNAGPRAGPARHRIAHRRHENTTRLSLPTRSSWIATS